MSLLARGWGSRRAVHTGLLTVAAVLLITSRYAFGRVGGGTATCGDMRKGCDDMVADNGRPYSHVRDAQQPDSKSR